MEPLLEVRDLTVRFPPRAGRGAVLAVDRVSFQLFPGEVLALVGASGSGKSTLARAVTRLIPADGGQIWFQGREITHARGRELRETYRRMQMIFQSPTASFDPRRTLGDGITESLRNRGVPRRQAEEEGKRLLGRCGLPPEWMGRYPHQVSGGQCQRAAIARALAGHPELLICDEATSALDVTVQRQILDLLRELQKAEGMAYLFICHDLALVERFCHRVLVFHQGRVVEEGTPEQVIYAPQAEETRRLVQAAFWNQAAAFPSDGANPL